MVLARLNNAVTKAVVSHKFLCSLELGGFPPGIASSDVLAMSSSFPLILFGVRDVCYR